MREHSVIVRDFRANLKAHLRGENYSVVEDRNGAIAVVFPLHVAGTESWRRHPKDHKRLRASFKQFLSEHADLFGA